MTDATWDEEVLCVGGASWTYWPPPEPVWLTPTIGQSIGGEIPDSDDHPEARLVRALRDALVERDKLRASHRELLAATHARSDLRGVAALLTGERDEVERLRAGVADLAQMAWDLDQPAIGRALDRLIKPTDGEGEACASCDRPATRNAPDGTRRCDECGPPAEGAA